MDRTGASFYLILGLHGNPTACFSVAGADSSVVCSTGEISVMGTLLWSSDGFGPTLPARSVRRAVKTEIPSLEFPYRLRNAIGRLCLFYRSFSKVVRPCFSRLIRCKPESIKCDQYVRLFARKIEHSFTSCNHSPLDDDAQFNGLPYMHVQRLDKIPVELFNGFAELALGDVGF